MKIAKLFLLGLAVILFSCGKDDDPAPTADGLIGAWSITALEYGGSTITTVSGITITSDFTGVGKDMNMTVTFNQNPNTVTSQGSYTIALTTVTLGQSLTEDVMFNGFFGDGTWVLKDKTLTVTSAGVAQEATIISQTSTKLVIAIDTEQTQDLGGAGSIVTKVKGSYTLTKK
jgi:hypothetical protein